MENNVLIGALFILPLMGFLINGLLYKKNNLIWASVLGTTPVLMSFLCASVLFYRLYTGDQTSFEFNLGNWISVANLNVSFSFSFNRLSALMSLIITGVGSVIYLFSTEYMSHDETLHRYFSYLSLFILNMLILVLGSNLLVSFIGWEGVGLSSYLLIGYWYKDHRKSIAGMKAFIVNRVGDSGFILGMAFLFSNLGSLDYEVINNTAQGLNPLLATAAVLCIFIGVCGKSAQVPLHIWLPDAMAGPTPVSALIHAATMVTAGVFILFRLNGLLNVSEYGMYAIAVVGSLTAFLGAFAALSQDDIKKILAYSTVSQLGFMILAIGIGAYVSAVFHLLTHAFFKALMFLGAGSVIHALDGEQDINKMGGLKKLMPITHITFVIGWLSIIGAPLFSGFFSKDEILFHTFHNERGSVLLWIIALLAATMTAFYMTRMMFKVFWAESVGKKNKTANDGGVLFKASLILLSVAALCSGFLGVPHILSFLASEHFLHFWLDPMLVVKPVENHAVLLEWVLMSVSTVFAFLAALISYFYYQSKNEKLNEVVEIIHKPALVLFSKNAGFFDQFYLSKIIKPFIEVSQGLWTFIDDHLLDRIFVDSPRSVLSVGKASKFIQSGNVQAYISIFAAGVAFFIIGSLFL